MRKGFSFLVGIILCLSFIAMVNYCTTPKDLPFVPTRSPVIYKAKLNKYITVRLLILKHSFERVADEESRRVIEVVDFAESEGLDIRKVGEHHFNLSGRTRPRIVWRKACSFYDLKAFISEQMKVEAEPDDTFVIYTTGHGSGGGHMAQVGERREVQRIFAEAAEENNQETLWWQSSCYAAAGLLPINSLNSKQQGLLSMITSSSANRVSYWHDQIKPMKGVFSSLATMGEDIDPDQSASVTAGELQTFLITVKGDADCLLFAKNDSEIIFGLNWARVIPILNPDGTLFPHEPDYIPIPRDRMHGY